MSNLKHLIAAIGCRNGQAVSLDQGHAPHQCLEHTDLNAFVYDANNNGADGILIYDLSETDEDHERSIGMIKEAARIADIPIMTGGRVRRLEDVKKYLYAGAKAVFLDGADADNIDLIKEASSRFGSEKIYIRLADSAQLARLEEFYQLGASAAILDVRESAGVKDPGASAAILDAREGAGVKAPGGASGSLLLICGGTGAEEQAKLLGESQIRGLILTGLTGTYMERKHQLAQLGIDVDIFQSSVSWDQFKKNSDGLIPVIVQDYKTSQVLMLAYMNEQAFADTLRTGKMHYYSRSRQSQWLKGETSGHFQYVKSLHLDCDNDTILAKVHQIGAACHTGAQSCFFQTLAEKEYKETNPLKVFEDVFHVILDRKLHPKEGSYTNYLFDKGIDKILKKVGEEATEIIIAAKNPDPEEIKYEISDFLYHVMVLMAEKGVTWEEITEELANR